MIPSGRVSGEMFQDNVADVDTCQVGDGLCDCCDGTDEWETGAGAFAISDAA